MNDIKKAINHFTMLRRLDSGEKKGLYDLAISALEKQIPKKPKLMETTLVGEKFWWYCGHCGASLHTNTKHNHCSYCGGKVDWGNKDE